jgi:hypothetical protein
VALGLLGRLGIHLRLVHGLVWLQILVRGRREVRLAKAGVRRLLITSWLLSVRGSDGGGEGLLCIREMVVRVLEVLLLIQVPRIWGLAE